MDAFKTRARLPPAAIPVAARRFAMRHGLNLRLCRNESGRMYWYELGDDMTRAMYPTAQNAIALCKRVLRERERRQAA